MKNSAKIKGNNNNVFQDISSFEADIYAKEEKKSQKQTYKIIGLIVAIITLIVSIIIGWYDIINFFNKI